MKLTDLPTITSYVYRTPRIARFLAMGGVASLAQLFLLYLIQLTGISKVVANIIAFELSTQINFTLSYLITWRDRTPPVPTRRYVVQRLFAFNGMAVTTGVINIAVFALLLPIVHYLIAGALGIITATAINFLVSAHLIFRPQIAISPRDEPTGALKGR